MERKGFLTDYKRIQVISGLAALSGAIMTLIILFFLPINYIDKRNIIIIVVSVIIFVAIFYTIPALYLNKKLSMVSDLFYILAITLVMKNIGDYGYIYFTFYMILAAVDAFIFPAYQYAILISAMCVGILVANISPDFIIQNQIIYQIYGVLTLSIILRLIARDALLIKERKEVLETDITELENDKREIRILLGSLAEGMFIVDEKNKITFFNKSALEILNVIAPEDKIISRDINDILKTVGPNGPESVTKDPFGKLEPSRRNDFRIIFPDRVVKLHTNVSPVIGERGEVSGAIIFFRDITKEKNLEEQRAEFNAIASHELRSPLSVIEGYLFFLLDPASKAKYDNVTRGYIEKAHDASRELIQLITDVLTVVKAENNELELNISDVDVKKIIEKSKKEYEKQAEIKKIKLELVLAVKNIPIIKSDDIKIKEIANNLIGNALKFTEKGSVTIEIGMLENEIIISVTDTGPGISKEDQALVFKKFFRSEDWKTRKTGGTGLGLYIVKTLTERLGGRAGLQSVVDKGSKFYFTLPLELNNKEKK